MSGYGYEKNMKLFWSFYMFFYLEKKNGYKTVQK